MSTLRALTARWRTTLRRTPALPDQPTAPAHQPRYYGPWRSVVLIDPAHHQLVVGACDFFDPDAAQGYAALVAEHAPHLTVKIHNITWSTEKPQTSGWWIDAAENVVPERPGPLELWTNFPPPTAAPPV